MQSKATRPDVIQWASAQFFAVRGLAAIYQHDLDSPGPTVADLARLCAEPELDYAILKHEFPGLYAATNGRVYIYDCQQVRAKLKMSTPFKELPHDPS